MTDTNRVLDAADRGLEQSLDRLFDLVRIPSISTDPAYKADCGRAADWCAKELANQFVQNFSKYATQTPAEILAAAPKVG